MKNITTREINGGRWYSREDKKPLSLSEIVHILQEIIDTKGDITMWKWDNGIAKTINYVHLMERSDGLIGAFIES